MPKSEKKKTPSFLTRLGLEVDRKNGRTPAEGEDVTPQTKTEIKTVLIGAGVVAVAAGAAIFAAVKFAAKDVLETIEESDSDEDTDNDED